MITREEYDKLSPREQGYVTYMCADRPGWDIPKECPYPRGSKQAQKWGEGATIAMLEAQDEDDS